MTRTSRLVRGADGHGVGEEQGPEAWSCRCGSCGQIWRNLFATKDEADTFLWAHRLTCMRRLLVEDGRCAEGGR